MNRFVAIDVETANYDISSICQIGIAIFENNEVIREWVTLIDPQDDFDGMNISIHGIDEGTIKGAPTLPDITNQLYRLLNDNIVVCHTHFDRVSIGRALTKHGLDHPDCTWLDSARVTRRTWNELSKSGYGLANVCKMIGYEFQHHDALEDAKAAGQIMIAAMSHSGLNIEDWVKGVEMPINPSTYGVGKAVKRDGNPEGDLYGEVVVFTGALTIPRGKAADMASNIGCKVNQSITKKTTILVVGDQDLKRLAGHKKSSKHRKAEEHIEKGIPIRIIQESDFAALASYKPEQRHIIISEKEEPRNSMTFEINIDDIELDDETERLLDEVYEQQNAEELKKKNILTRFISSFKR